MRTHIKGSIEHRGTSYRAVFWQNGKRLTATFTSQARAREWLLDMNAEAETLSGAELTDACAAVRLLREGVTLVDCVEYYNKHCAQTTDTPLNIIVETFLGDKVTELRATTFANYRRILGHIVDNFRALADITPEATRTYTDPLTAHARNTTLRVLSSFFSWCVDRGYASQNPCEKIKLSRTEAPKRQVLSLEDAQTLLDTALRTDTDLLPYIAICMFAGVRPDECKKLTATDVGEDYIMISEAHSKTHAARTIPVADNLRAILAAHPIHKRGVTFGLSNDRFKKRVSALIKASGITWANDIMRHSYASYHYEQTKDAAATAANLGHTDTSMLFRHYRGLVPPKTGEKYFQITP